MPINPFLEKINQTPHANKLKMQLVATEESAVTIKLPYSEHIIGDPFNNIIHSGAITTLIDTACGSAIFQTQQNLRALATLDLRVDYMRPAVSTKDIQAYAHCYKLTDTIAFVRATVFTESIDDPVATAMCTFMRSQQEFPTT